MVTKYEINNTHRLPAAIYMSIPSLELERCRLGLVPPRISSKKAWCIVEEGINVLVSAFLYMSC